ncbi:MAG TPA: host attachment protein, partial [Prosthecobacter sp.]
GLKKLSEQVTDKAGGFPASETNGHGNSAAERLPLQEELETRTFRKITQRIRDLLGDNRFETWGLVAPPEVNNAVIDALDAKQVGRLTVNLKLDLTGQPPDSLKRRLLAA